MGQVQPPMRRLHPPASEELLDAAIVIGLLSTGTGCDPTAEGGIFERLREMTERIAMPFQLLFELRASHAGFERGSAVGFVQVEQTRHAFKRECQRRRAPSPPIYV